MYRLKTAYKKRKGVPIGYIHRWHYNGQWKEKKFRNGRWIFRFRATKSRKGSALGGLPIGSTVVWKINAIQKAKKIGGRKYLTDMIGFKKLIGKKIRR